MDKDTRNAIERATQRARKLLEEDFAAQLEGDFDVHRRGTVGAKAGEHLTARQAFQRERIISAIEHKRSAGISAQEAVADYLRDAAFTTLNRFAALKMLEARALVQECITKGEQSAGYREFCGMVPGLPLLLDDAGYRLYIECLFDELSTEVKVLFDRRDPSSVLWPRRATFEQLLEILNASELSIVWAEDETIGWVYQYFNSREERAALRDTKQGGSTAPRNSRELAVRNQFFTPRYVVQFLTDNTLGRIWYEMRGAATALFERCVYMVRGLGEELPPRDKKDPRDIRVLDPACGSGHFLLYAFELLLMIYEEAYADPESPRSESTGRRLAEDYPNLDALRKAAPVLILAHNLYGVDIDPRCAQIAQLALWLRTQRAYRDKGFSRASRPIIRRSNIVVAEPLVADEIIAKEFIAGLGDVDLGRAFGALIEALKLAGDLGLLLPVEALVTRQSKRGESGDLFAPLESRIRDALERFVAAEGSRLSTRKRLFADDAAEGIGLLSIAEKKFDVVLMNPPFGMPIGTLPQLYSHSKEDIDCAFVTRATTMLRDNGFLGAIVNRTQFTKITLEAWRRSHLVGQWKIRSCADFGLGVLDGAMVEAAAYILSTSTRDSKATFFRLTSATDKGDVLSHLVQAPACETKGERFLIDIADLAELPSARIAYWLPHALRQVFGRWKGIEGRLGTARQGTITSDNFRFLRLAWEVGDKGIATNAAQTIGGQKWVLFAKGGEYSPYYQDLHLVVNWSRNGYEIRNFVDENGELRSRPQGLEWNFKRALTYSERTASNLSVRLCPPGCFYSQVGPVIGLSESRNVRPLLGILMSRVVAYLIEVSAESAGAVTRGGAARHYTQGVVGTLPIPPICDGEREQIDNLVADIWKALASCEQTNETSRYFASPFSLCPPHVLGKLDSFAIATYEQIEQRFIEVIEAAWKIELLVRKMYGLDDEAAAEIDREVGPHPGSWSVEPLVEGDDDLWSAELDEVIARLVARDGPSRSITKMCFFADRRTELLAHLHRVHPRSVIASRRQHNRLPAGFKVQKAFDVLSYALGVAFGRWHAGKARDSLQFSDEAPVPAALPGRRADIPSPCSILVDDEGHSADIVVAVTAAAATLHIEELLSDCAVQAEGGHGSLRDLLRQRFFDEHVGRYSASRRKAPIYWQLATPSASYSVWLYIHAFSKDTLFRVQNDYAAPKLAHEERRLESLTSELRDGATAAQRKALAAQEAIVEDLRAFLEEVKRVAPLWNPNLDDGVVINFAPLWRLVPQNKPWQKELKSTWDALCQDEYDWAHLAMHLWPERVVLRCTKDRSLAIAHGLEDVLWVEGSDGKWTARKTPTRSVADLVRERTSPAVKSALKSLLEAPAATGNGGRGRSGRREVVAAAERGHA